MNPETADAMTTIFITNNERRAQVAELAGVDRIMVDLETIGKVERQKNLDTLISHHSLTDVGRLRSLLSRALLMVRINPMHDNTAPEIDACISAGANVLMLPMITHAGEVERFVEMVDGRAQTCLLLETGAAFARLNHILSVKGIDEIHIGLNDLHLSLKLVFMFELMTGGLIDYAAQSIRNKGLRFGIGGIARLGRGLVSPELILSEHVRLGSSQVLLSRDFNLLFEEHEADSVVTSFRREIGELHRYVESIRSLGSDIQGRNSLKLKRALDAIVRPRLEQSGNSVETVSPSVMT